MTARKREQRTSNTSKSSQWSEAMQDWAEMISASFQSQTRTELKPWTHLSNQFTSRTFSLHRGAERPWTRTRKRSVGASWWTRGSNLAGDPSYISPSPSLQLLRPLHRAELWPKNNRFRKNSTGIPPGHKKDLIFNHIVHIFSPEGHFCPLNWIFTNTQITYEFLFFPLSPE